MKGIILKKILVLSQTEKKGKEIDFDPECTTFTSIDNDGIDQNRTGKSLILKSIIHSLGGNLTQYPTNWNELNITTILDFIVGETEYKLIRIGNKFILKGGSLNKKYESISELKNFYQDILLFNLKLENKQTKKIEQVYPGAYLFPLYIDQDKDWDGSYGSMKDIKMYKDWKKEILGYHVGKDLVTYYDLTDEQNVLKVNEKKKVDQRDLLQNYINVQIDKSKDIIDIRVDEEKYVKNIENYTSIINELKERNIKIEENLRVLADDRYLLKNKIKIASRSLLEIEQDEKYLSEKIKSRKVKCPTCGTIHENKITHRYKIYSNIEKIRKREDQYTKELVKIENEITRIKIDYIEIIGQLNNYNKIMSEKNETQFTFNQIISSKVLNKLIDDVRKDITLIDKTTLTIGGRINQISKEKSKISRENNKIDKSYSEYMNNNLLSLEVSDMDHTTKKKIGNIINSTGNDISRAVLADFFAYAKLISENNNEKIPIIIDTPLQQEPSSHNINLVFDFITKNSDKFQLILANTQHYGFDIQGKNYNFLDKNSVLEASVWDRNENIYQELLDEMYNTI